MFPGHRWVALAVDSPLASVVDLASSCVISENIWLVFEQSRERVEDDERCVVQKGNVRLQVTRKNNINNNEISSGTITNKSNGRRKE